MYMNVFIDGSVKINIQVILNLKGTNSNGLYVFDTKTMTIQITEPQYICKCPYHGFATVSLRLGFRFRV